MEFGGKIGACLIEGRLCDEAGGWFCFGYGGGIGVDNRRATRGAAKTWSYEL